MYTTLLMIVGALALALYSFYKWFTKKHDYFKKRGIPYIRFWDMNKGGKGITKLLTYLHNCFPNDK